MALSPAHQFGQIIGDMLEAAMLLVLQEFVQKHDLFLDCRGPRPCRRGKKCTWVDANGNAHDLDFVLERGGTPDRVGTPVAFIETAWRRYTKHSRNKVQEIQGAIEPLAQKYRHSHPFKGAVLAGIYTAGAITQLHSLGYCVLYLPIEHVIAAFRQCGVDASSDESTSDAEFLRKIAAFRRLTSAKKRRLAQRLIPASGPLAREFIARLKTTVCRTIERVIVLALHGTAHEANDIGAAIHFIERYSETEAMLPIERFEVEVRYGNGDLIRGSFADNASAIDFLCGCRPSC